jgi:hypothetical protein
VVGSTSNHGRAPLRAVLCARELISLALGELQAGAPRCLLRMARKRACSLLQQTGEDGSRLRISRDVALSLAGLAVLAGVICPAYHHPVRLCLSRREKFCLAAGRIVSSWNCVRRLSGRLLLRHRWLTSRASRASHLRCTLRWCAGLNNLDRRRKRGPRCSRKSSCQ